MAGAGKVGQKHGFEPDIDASMFSQHVGGGIALRQVKLPKSVEIQIFRRTVFERTSGEFLLTDFAKMERSPLNSSADVFNLRGVREGRTTDSYRNLGTDADAAAFVAVE